MLRALPLLTLMLLLAPARPGRAEPVLYPLYSAAGLYWLITVSGDDGLTTDSETIVSFCCSDVDAWLLGDKVGIVSPTFTPTTLLHMVDREAVPGQVGLIPLTLDIAGSLEWSPPSGPTLSPGQSGSMETGDASDADFHGTLSTSLGTIPFDLGLVDHVGLDMTLRHYDGAADVGPPRLVADTVVNPLDSLEVDEGEQPGRIEMRNPYQAVLGTSASIAEAGDVTYALDSAAGMLWTVTITASDGQTSASDGFTTFCCTAIDATVSGNTVGIVDPVFTPSGVSHTIDRTGLPLTLGSIGVTLDLSGALEWSPPFGPGLASGQGDFMDTGSASAASFVGTLFTTVGDVPFSVGLTDHVNGGLADMTLRRFDGASDVEPPRLQIDTVTTPLDRLELDERDQPGRIEMREPYEAVLGSAGGVTFSISAEVVWNDVVYALVPSAPNGTVRDVTWSVDSEVLFNDVFTIPEPSSQAMIAAALPLLIALARRRARRA